MSHKAVGLTLIVVITLVSFIRVGADGPGVLYLPIVRKDTNDLSGGNIVDIETSPGLPHVMMASLRSPSGNWLKPRYSLNRGLTWQNVETVPVNYQEIAYLEIAVAPKADQTTRFFLLVGTTNGIYLYRSGDYGRTWARIDLDSLVPLPTGRVSLSNLVASPANPSQLYLAYSEFIDSPYEPVISGYAFSSVDAGVEWNVIWSGLDRYVDVILPSPSVAQRAYFHIGIYTQWERRDDQGWEIEYNFPYNIYHLTLDSTDPARLYSIEAGRSTNGGDTWTPWNNPPCSFRQLMAHPNQTKVLYVLCDTGLYRSSNGGDRWSQLSTIGDGFLIADYGVPGRLLWVRNDGVYVSCDDGVLWLPINPGCTLTATSSSGDDLSDEQPDT